MIILSWFLSFIISLLHLLLILIFAPYMMMVIRQCEAKILGMPVENLYIACDKVKENISRLFIFFSSPYLTMRKFTLLIPFGMVLTASLLIPTFTTGMVLTEGADFLFIVSLLTLTPVCFIMVHDENASLLFSKQLPRLIINSFLFLPMLFFMAMVCKLTTNSNELNHIVLFFHQSTNLLTIALCPLLISAFSLFFLLLDIPDLSTIIERDGFEKEERVVLLYVNDLRFLAWLSLMAFFLWPQSIAVLDLQRIAFTTWLIAAFFGLLAWIVKLFFGCIIIALIKNLLFISRGLYKIGIATVLNFLAVIIYFAGLSGM